jgi:hypothetical protein
MTEKHTYPLPAGKDLREGPKAEEVADNQLMDLPTKDSKPYEANTEAARARALGKPFGSF